MNDMVDTRFKLRSGMCEVTDQVFDGITVYSLTGATTTLEETHVTYDQFEETNHGLLMQTALTIPPERQLVHLKKRLFFLPFLIKGAIIAAKAGAAAAKVAKVSDS